MSLIKSISGIRGIIGGKVGENLTPIDIVECTSGYALWLKSRGSNPSVVVGRDGRISGPMVSSIAIQTLIGMGIDVIDIGLSTTPTVEMAVTHMNASGGIIFTASHNPKQWNALKFLNEKGEFISAQDGQLILDSITNGQIQYADVDHLGSYTDKSEYGYQYHIDQILKLPYVDKDLISKENIHVVVDAINSTGAHAIPALLDNLGVRYTMIHNEVTGDFAHNPEPLAEHLFDLKTSVETSKAAMGISVDPDVDRLCFVSENGEMFGEEYTLVAIADHVLSYKKGATVSNLSSTRALRDLSNSYGATYHAAAVGEVNVVNMMKSTNAVIGGEGNGGVIVPELHYGRDALAGIAMFLTYYAKKGKKMSDLKMEYAQYAMVKDKVSIYGKDVEAVLKKIKGHFNGNEINEIDGIKIDLSQGWIHIRKSNTEPIIRIYTEAATDSEAKELVDSIKNLVD